MTGPSCLDAMRSFDLLRIAPVHYDKHRNRDYSFCLDSAELESRGCVAGPLALELERMADQMRHAFANACATVKEKLDWQRLNSPPSPEGTPRGLELRNWRPGDQYCRIGRARPEKIKLMFQEFRIPLWERHEWPVLTAAGSIVWALRFGPAAEFAARADSPVLLSIRETANRNEGF
jgi:tRNA(Ile)-lysidine synthetase-like protein